MHDAPSSFRATLLDGNAPPAPGTLSLDQAELVLDMEMERRASWRLDQILDARAIGRDFQIELPPEVVGEPRIKIVVQDPAFEEVLGEALSRFGGSATLNARRAGRRLGLLGWALIAAIVLPAGYFAYTVLAPRLHVLVSPEREARLGDFVYEAVADEWTQLEAPLFSDFVARVVGELRAPESPYDIRISLVDQEDLNAMALPGGRIVVFSGLVKASPSPDALAGVLAHELSHVERRHSLKHIMRSIGLIQFAGAAVGGGIDGFELAETFVEASSGLLILRHSRLAETDADTVAVGKLRRAGRSAEGLIEFFDLIQEKYGDLPGTLGWLSTHPMTAQRVDRIKRLLEARPNEDADAVQPSMSTKPWMSAEDWKLLQLEID